MGDDLFVRRIVRCTRPRSARLTMRLFGRRPLFNVSIFCANFSTTFRAVSLLSPRRLIVLRLLAGSRLTSCSNTVTEVLVLAILRLGVVITKILVCSLGSCGNFPDGISIIGWSKRIRRSLDCYCSPHIRGVRLWCRLLGKFLIVCLVRSPAVLTRYRAWPGNSQ